MTKQLKKPSTRSKVAAGNIATLSNADQSAILTAFQAQIPSIDHLTNCKQLVAHFADIAAKYQRIGDAIENLMMCFEQDEIKTFTYQVLLHSPANSIHTRDYMRFRPLLLKLIDVIEKN